MWKSLEKKIILFFARVVARPMLLVYRFSLNIKVKNRHYVENCRRRGENVLFSVWHENMILPLLVHENQGVYVLVSQHFDGEVIAYILRTFGCYSVRGSSTRGGKKAFKEMKEKMKNGRSDLAFTPDGPTGPRRQTKLGIIRLASESGSPIIPIGVAASKYRRLNTWDKFLFVFPFSRCSVIYHKPLYVVPTDDLDLLKSYADKLTRQTDLLDLEAQECLVN
jgi:lysophospholipid acyltransferase (LPLAT)-like uncharacterized protein